MKNNSKIESLIQKYDRPVPRYTSYPTAVQFSDSVGAAEYERWLASVLPEKPLSLYIHVPFCRTLCLYCGCNTKALGDNYSPVAAYVAALKSEMTRAADIIGRKQSVSHIHFGGGTPTFLQPKDMEKVFAMLRDCFSVPPDAEISIEIDPRLITQEQIESLATLGVNRVSLGVQDFNPEVQKAIGRIQSYETVVKVTEAFRDAGIHDINFDMMYGLPLQTVDSVEDNARKVAALKPGRIALFGYAHVPWMKKNQKVLEQYKMPDAAARYEQFAVSREIWLDSGYKEIGIDHFALPDDELYIAFESGNLHRNFMGYVMDESDVILGFGASSISAFPQGYLQNVTDTKTYQKTQIVTRGLKLTSGDIPRREIIEALMCYGRADIGDMQMPLMLSGLEKDGVVQCEGSIVTVTDKGRPFLRVVCSAFDEYFEEKEGRHARAV